MKKIIISTLLMISTSAFAVQYESGRFVGTKKDTNMECSLTVDLSADGDYAENDEVIYSLRPAYRSTPDVNCPGEHKRYVGFQVNDEDNKEIEICVSLDNKFMEYTYNEFNSNNVLIDQYTCVIEQKVNQ